MIFLCLGFRGRFGWENSSKFLFKLDLLQLELPINLHPVLDTLKIFSGVVEGCFSYELCTNYKEKIMDFRDSYKNLMVYSKKSRKFPLTVTWKVHCVTAHLEYMLTKQGKGMAHFAEQTGEAAYHKMKPAHSRSENHKEPWTDTAHSCHQVCQLEPKRCETADKERLKVI